MTRFFEPLRGLTAHRCHEMLPKMKRANGPARLGSALALALALPVASASAAPPADDPTAEAGDEAAPPRAPSRPRRFDKADPVEDPRTRELPRRHRFRLGLASHYIRLSAALSNQTNEATRFHHAPLMLDFAYQLQFAKRMMLRPGLSVGYNVANSRFAMPLAIVPRLMTGYQGRWLGLAVGYAYISTGHPFATLKDGADGRANSVGAPVIFRNHGVLGEISVTSRIDETALYFALGLGGTRTHLLHFDLDTKSWRFTMHFGVGVYFDGSRRRRKQREAEAARSP